MVWKLLLILFLGIEVVACAHVHAGDQEAQNIKDKVKESIYRLESGGHGTAFVVKSARGKKLLISNDHVCDMANMFDSMNAIDHTGESHLVKVLHRSPYTDLCILSAPQNAIALPIAKSNFKDQKVFAVGYPLSKFMVAQFGRLKGRETSRIVDDKPINECTQPKNHISRKKVPIRQIDGSTIYIVDIVCTIKVEGYFTTIPVDKGFSGSPMLNSDGEVSGVIFAMQGNVSWGAAVDLVSLRKYLGYSTK